MDALRAEQLRVLACLAEKEATVPDAYPLSRNALRQACNQSSSRDPVVAYDDRTVDTALDELKALGLVRFVHPSHGERTTRYRHVLDERLGLDPAELAVLTVLALRGPQSAPELRTRTERQHAFAGADDVERTLRALAEREDPLVVHLGRLAGQREARWAHLLAGPVDVDALAAAPPAAPRSRPDDALREELDALRQRVDRLERELGLEAAEPDLPS